VAATVNGSDITVGDVEDLIHVEGGTITKQQFAQFLGYQIQLQIVRETLLEEYGIDLTDEAIAAEADEIYATATAQGQPNAGQTREQFTEGNGVTEKFLLLFAEQNLLFEEVSDLVAEGAEPPTQEEIDTAMQAAFDEATEVCVSHILLGELQGLTGEELDTAKAEAEAAAQDVLERLASGEDFAALATELSTDTASGANGGDLGCSSPRAYLTEFGDATLTAPIGEVLDTPVETLYGFHVMLVNERTEPGADELPTEDEIIEQLEAGSLPGLVQEWVIERMAGADVTVEERFGSWQTDPEPVVVPPAE
jgi:parvulin-like peptidyl-prolyl isomerase